jgi:hypothetical protein
MNSLTQSVLRPPNETHYPASMDVNESIVVTGCIIIGIHVLEIAVLRFLLKSLINGRLAFKVLILLQHLVKVLSKDITMLPISYI